MQGKRLNCSGGYVMRSIVDVIKPMKLKIGEASSVGWYSLIDAYPEST